MNIIRKYKLGKLTGVNYLSEKEKELINFVNSRLENLSEFITPKDKGCINLMDNEGNLMLKYDKKTSYLWVRYHGFIEVLDYKYMLDEKQMDIILYYMMACSYKFKIKEILTISHTSDVEYLYKATNKIVIGN